MLADLRTLELTGCDGIDDTEVMCLTRLTALQDLSLWYAIPIGPRMSSALGLLPARSIRRLELTVAPEDDVDLAAALALDITKQIIKLSSLEHLLVERWMLNIQCVPWLGALRGLRTLKVYECHTLQDDALRLLAVALPQLEEFFLYHSDMVTDVGVEAIAAGMRQLRRLVMARLVVTDRALRCLAPLRATLEEVAFRGAEIHSIAVSADAVVDLIDTMPLLRRVYLAGVPDALLYDVHAATAAPAAGDAVKLSSRKSSALGWHAECHGGGEEGAVGEAMRRRVGAEPSASQPGVTSESPCESHAAVVAAPAHQHLRMLPQHADVIKDLVMCHLTIIL
jgi:hypothetical protein